MPIANDRIGPYTFIRKLGEGAFGEVWLAQDCSGPSPDEVAVKLPRKSVFNLDALLQEAIGWARATGHDNVLRFLGARELGGQVMLISEYAPDGSLKDWLQRHGGRAPSVAEAVKMTRGILAGLEHLHERGIFHRDVKPDNVLLLGTTPRLADFGLASVLKTTSESEIIAGTPHYMAPEAFEAKRNERTDLWSVGVMLYQMLSGRLPFKGSNQAEVSWAVCNKNPDPLSNVVPKWLQQVISKALTKDPKQRYQTAADMLAALVTEEKVPPSRLRLMIKWGTGLAVVIALAIYLITRALEFGPPPKPLDLGPAFTENLNGINLEMVRVPSGKFLMGSPGSEKVYRAEEVPQHQVTVPSFYIGKYEVTNAQWRAAMGSNPQHPKGDELPVDFVSWSDAKEFCQKLSELTGKTYRLPSEAEWEYACRAGTTGAYAGDLDAMAWCTDTKSDDKTHSVGQKKPNTFGLHDMHGNISEWCEDVWHDSYGGRHGDPPTDGSAWLNGGEQDLRIRRGGSIFTGPAFCRAASRLKDSPDKRNSGIGFRVAVTVKTQ